MNLELIGREFKSKICDEIALTQEGLSRFIVFNPFMFDDGDHLVVLLKGKEGKWLLPMRAYVYVSYDDIDIDKGTRKKVIDNVLVSYGIKTRKEN